MKEKNNNAPDWAWSIRATTFPECPTSSGIDEHRQATSNPVPTIDDYMKTSDEVFLAQAKELAEKGVNLVCVPWMFHFRMNHIDNLDKITEVTRRITEACHKFGVRVYEHHSANFFNLFPDENYVLNGWDITEGIVVDIRTGQQSLLGVKQANPLAILCINNRHFIEAYKTYITGHVEKTGLDGFMEDDIHFGGQYHCGCRFCREKFEKMMGYPLPVGEDFPVNDFNSRIWRDWTRFRIQSVSDHLKEIRASLPDDFLFFTCHGGTVVGNEGEHHAGVSSDKVAEATNCYFSECSIQFRNEQLWHPHNYFDNWEKIYCEKKYARALCDVFNQPAILLQYPDNPQEGIFTWSVSKMFGASLWRSLANIYGSRTYGDEFTEWRPEYDYLNWEKEHQHLFEHPENLKDIGVVFSAATKQNLGLNSSHHGEPWTGWVESLMVAGIQADGMTEYDLKDMDRLNQFKLVILPNVECLSEEIMQNLLEYVKNGGNLIATHMTSMRDEGGDLRENFGLAEMFGVNFDCVDQGTNDHFFLDRRFHGEPEFGKLSVLYSADNSPKVTWEGEDENTRTLAWRERLGNQLEDYQRPAIRHRKIGKGQVIYCTARIGTYAYQEGLFPIWSRRYHEQEYIDRQPIPSDENKRVKGWALPEKYHGVPQNVYIDESRQEYRQLITALVASLHPSPEVVVKTPKGVAFNVFKRTQNTGGTTKLTLSLLNMTGSAFNHGDMVASPAVINYPELEGEIRITLKHEVDAATCFSFDDKDKPAPAAKIENIDGRAIVTIDASVLRRCLFVEIATK